MLGKYISQELDKGIMPGGVCLPCEDIAAFADDRLDRESRKRVEAHLADCRECYQLYANTIAAKLVAAGRADAPGSEKCIAKLLLYAIPTALVAGLALLVFSGNFKVSAPGGTAPSESKMPAGSSVPIAEIIKNKDEFRNMTGHQGKK